MCLMNMKEIDGICQVLAAILHLGDIDLQQQLLLQLQLLLLSLSITLLLQFWVISRWLKWSVIMTTQSATSLTVISLTLVYNICYGIQYTLLVYIYAI